MTALVYSELWGIPYVLCLLLMLGIAVAWGYRVKKVGFHIVRLGYVFVGAFVSVLLPSLWTYLAVGFVWGVTSFWRSHRHERPSSTMASEISFTAIMTVVFTLFGPITMPFAYAFIVGPATGD